MTTPNGSRKMAATVGIPVRALTTAEPPTNNIAVTRMLVIKPKTIKTTWASVPYLALITSRKVYHLLVSNVTVTIFQNSHEHWELFFSTQLQWMRTVRFEL